MIAQFAHAMSGTEVARMHLTHVVTDLLAKGVSVEELMRDVEDGFSEAHLPAPAFTPAATVTVPAVPAPAPAA